MSARAAVAEIMQAIAAEIEAGSRPDPAVQEIVTLFAANGATPDIATAFFTEARRKIMNTTLVEAAGFMLQEALSELRVAANSGDPRAPRALQAAVDAVLRLLSRGRLPAVATTLLVRCFTTAQLVLPEALCEAMDQAAIEGADDQPVTGDADPTRHLKEVAAMLDHDPFAIYGQMVLTAAAIPPEQRAAMAGVLAGAAEPSLRAAAVGFAFAPEPRATGFALAAIAEQGRVAPADPAARWLRLARPWFATDRHRAIDAAIDVLGAPQPASPPPERTTLLASITDGAGANSLFAVFKIGRKHRLAGLLLKRDTGVFDVWLQDGVSKAESSSLMRKIQQAIDPRPISTELAGRILADALAVNVARDAPPPFELLRIMELLGIETLVPYAPSTDSLIAEVLMGLPAARTGSEAVSSAHLFSADWADQIGTMDSWFEAGAEVHGKLRPLRTAARRFDYIMTTLLPGRRAIWARNCAWAAMILRDECACTAGRHDKTWVDMGLVARDLAGDRPLSEIPLALQIAGATLQAFNAG